MIRIPLPIDESIGACVANVGTKLLIHLQEANPAIHTVNYMFGHPLELLKVLQDMTKSKTSKYLKFPLVMLFGDVDTVAPSVKGAELDYSITIVIAMSTQPTLAASQRIEQNFEPVLRPIYNELLEQIFRSGFFWVQSPRQLMGNATERLYWGRTGLYGNDANIFDDHIDAIEIKGLKLTPTLKGAVNSPRIAMIWRTAVLDIVDSPARPALSFPVDETVFIPVGAGKYLYKQYAAGPTVTPICAGDTVGYLAGKTIELPWYYSDNPTSIFDYDSEAGTWSEAANGNFSSGAYLTIKFYDNV